MNQIFLYILSGLLANLIDILGFYGLYHMGVWYVLASFMSGAVGFVSAFVLQKYVVFQKRQNGTRHFTRYCILGAFNIIAISVILYCCVEYLSLSKEIAKIIANGGMASWNFLIMKRLIYV